MLGRKQEINLQLNQILDAALIVVAFFLSHSIRYYGQEAFFEPLGRPQILELDKFYWIVAIAAPFLPIALEFEGYYNAPLQKHLWQSLQQLAKAFLWIGLAIGAFVIFFRSPVGSRFFLPLFAFNSAVFLLAKEAVVRSYLRKKVASGNLRERVILAGTPESLDALIAGMADDQKSLMAVVGRIDLGTEPVEALVKCLHATSAERVIFATAHVYFDKIEQAIRACELEGVEAWLAADFIQTSIARPNFDVLCGRPMIVFRSTPEISWSLLFKDLIDRAGALFFIALLGWLAVPVALGIRLSSPGPVLFKQQRSGRHGRPFTMLKFRTMTTDAEQRRAELQSHNEMSGPVFKLEEDPRIFPFGRFLRRYSIDELPQLLNVLMGDMSLVGPRPLPTYEVDKIADTAQRRRLSVKPGLTCLWQISGRNKITSFEEWVSLDLQYIDNWSIWLDFVILLKTIPVVVLGSGAK
jgi:exopolysaccharide biosynthesis polyprenyl glycosylphosphotransferase